MLRDLKLFFQVNKDNKTIMIYVPILWIVILSLFYTYGFHQDLFRYPVFAVILICVTIASYFLKIQWPLVDTSALQERLQTTTILHYLLLNNVLLVAIFVCMGVMKPSLTNDAMWASITTTAVVWAAPFFLNAKNHVSFTTVWVCILFGELFIDLHRFKQISISNGYMIALVIGVVGYCITRIRLKQKITPTIL